ncbi:Putative Phosphatidylinositol phosphate phosphatase [Rhizopus microsporus]|nr:Putative Phosphatidylinositol phosphate phosphatase [Rhizopus microsporus]
MSQGNVFPGYKEGLITFLPTYKYDVGTDIYDTSEKQRIPGWTDRILYKGGQLRQLQYSRAELYTSDHRPVFALFEADVITLDKEAKFKLQKEIYQSLSSIEVRHHPPELPKRKMTAPLPATKDPLVDVLIDISLDAPSQRLPPPSTDIRKWWEDGEGK